MIAKFHRDNLSSLAQAYERDGVATIRNVFEPAWSTDRRALLLRRLRSLELK